MARAPFIPARFGWRPSLLSLMVAAAGFSAIANAMASAMPAPADSSAPTRLGTSIQQSMRERDSALADQKRALDLREQAQKAAEQRLQNDLANQGGPGVPGSPLSPGGPGGVYDGLARIYQTMKPGKAAPIFEKLELDVQLQVARRMRERSTALLLASMSPDAAVELSMAMAGRHVVKAPPPKPVALPTPVRKPKEQALPRTRLAPTQATAEQAAPDPTPATK